MTGNQSTGSSSPERLAYWYFRINGFLTTENFVVHPDTGRNQRTDADLLAIRFKHRAENLSRPMMDDYRVASCVTYANVIIAEVKTGLCALNGPWTCPEAENMERVLKAIGCVPDREIKNACNALYHKGLWSDSSVTIRLFALGESRAKLRIPEQQQITWDEVIEFCVTRFKAYKTEKTSVGQWPEDGRRLKSEAESDEPNSRIRRLFGLRCDHGPGGRKGVQ